MNTTPLALKTGISIVVPCFNEEANLHALVSRVQSALTKAEIPFEIVLVDDGSSDSTWEIIQELAADANRRVRGIRNPTNAGILPSWLNGIQAAAFDMVCLMDADLQNPPEAIPQMWAAYNQTPCHIMQGTRSSIEWDSGARFRSSRGLNSILNLVFGDRAEDNKSGFVLAPTEILSDVLTYKKRYRYGHTFIRVSARSRGYQVGETETLFQPRHAGESFLSSIPSWRVYRDVLIDTIRAFGEFGRGSKHPLEIALTEHSIELAPEKRYVGLRRLRLNVYFWSMPLHAWHIRSSTKSIYELLCATQWLSRDQIRTVQLNRLKRLLWHAYVHVPYYRKAFEQAGITPADITQLEDLAKLPLLNKSDVSENLYFDLFSDTHDKRRMHKIATSGSTGAPFVTYADRAQLEVRFASTIRSAEWTGWQIGDRQVRLWHQTLGMSKSQQIKERLDAWLMRRTFIPAFELTEQSLKQLAKRLDRIKPVLMDGYAESLNFLALYLKRGGKLANPPKALMSSAQMLTAQTRQEIEEGLGARVFDKYGAREFSGIAYQCDASHDHHVVDESYILEILVEGRPAKPGEVGEVVITDLNNYSVPLIRYRIGDLALAVENESSCACGRGLSKIGEIQGRTQALVYCANGRWLPGTLFAHFFKDYDYVLQFFQVVQDEPGRITLKAVKGAQWSATGWDQMIVALREFIGDTEVTVEYVDEIPLLKTGKRTPVVSTVRVDFQELSK